MAGSINKVILVGNLGQDPRVANTQSGTKIVTFSLATSDTWRDKTSGERRDRTEWHNIVIFNTGLAETAERYLHKGSKVYLEGQLQTRSWEDQNGQKRYTTEVVLQNFNSTLVMLDGKGDGTPSGAADIYDQTAASGWDSSAGMSDSGSSQVVDDDIPF